MIQHYWPVFLELLASPFKQAATVWGIVPLYFALLLNETTSVKANFRTAVQTGFSFLWAAAQWIYPYFRAHEADGPKAVWDSMAPINLMVTGIVLVFGAAALVSGIRRKYPRYCAFLGYTRFANYFMIAIFPIQAHYLGWTWDRLAAIGMFAVPVWLVLHFGLMPIRNLK